MAQKDLPRGPLLALLQGSLRPNQVLCSAFQLASGTEDKPTCQCGASAGEHGMAPLSEEAWAQLYDKLVAGGQGKQQSRRDKPKRERRNNRREELEIEVPVINPVSGVTEKPFSEVWEIKEGEDVRSLPEAEDSDADESRGPDYEEWKDKATSFAKMDLSDELIQALDDYGLKEPTALQQRIVVPLTQGKCLLVKSMPGLEKLDGIAMAAIQSVKVDDPPTTQVIILCAAQESCHRLFSTLKTLAEPLSLRVLETTGGQSRNVKDSLQEGAHIICATLGRLYDLFKQRLVDGHAVQRFIVDGADTNFRQPFQRGHIAELIGTLPSEVGISVFFQSYTEGVAKIVKRFLTDPVQVVEKPAPRTDVKLSYIPVDRSQQKLDVFVGGLDLPAIDGSSVIIARARTALMIVAALQTQQWPVVAVLGKMEALDREKALQAWQEGIAPLLVTTDSCLDVLTGRADIVVNYELPLTTDRFIARTYACKPGGRIVSMVVEAYKPMLRKFQKSLSAKEETPAAKEDAHALHDAPATSKAAVEEADASETKADPEAAVEKQ